MWKRSRIERWKHEVKTYIRELRGDPREPVYEAQPPLAFKTRQPKAGDVVTFSPASGGSSVNAPVLATSLDPVGGVDQATPDGTAWYRWAPTPHPGRWNWPGGGTGL